MPFPETERVIYQVNPLDEVICQLRFPPILKIDAEPPAAFQERIRADYPEYEVKSPVKLPNGIPPAIAQLVSAELLFGSARNHEFRSKDQNWTITLTRDFLALTCKKYERWEAFRERLKAAFDALTAEYRPGYFLRLGLRYRDVIQPSKVGLVGESWSDLIRPEICGIAGHRDTIDDIISMQNQAVVRLPNDIGSVLVNTYLTIEERANESVFVIDSDFFTDAQTENDHVFPKLDAFKLQATHFFRWCITDRLHAAFQPLPVEARST